jgi:CubicO group peptidase (beta-lactamase class C family)
VSRLAELIAAAGFDENLPVALATVNREGGLEHAVAGRWSDGKDVEASDRFYGASLAKQITGAAAALLVRDGLLDPDAAIASWLGDLPRWIGSITARQLAHHTSGLPEAGIAEAALGWNWTEPAVAQYLLTLGGPTYPPNTEHRYSNLGYILIARLVAAITGMRFSEYVAARLVDSPDIGFPTGSVGFPHAAWIDRLPLTQGDGGLWTSATALAEWLDCQNRDVLSIAAITEAPGRLNDGSATDYGWGLGLREYRGQRALIHGGSWTGATGKSIRCPDLGIAAVTLTAGAERQKVGELTDAALEFAYLS